MKDLEGHGASLSSERPTNASEEVSLSSACYRAWVAILASVGMDSDLDLTGHKAATQ